MAEHDEDATRGASVIEISAVEVFARSDATLTAKVTCDPVCDLRGQTLTIKDSEGAALGSAEITDFEGESNQSAEIVIEAPAKAGTISWMASFPAHETDGVSYPEASASVDVTVKPHPVNLVVWDVPYAAGVGEQLSIKVGVKCGVACDLAGITLSIRDDEGNQLASADVGEEPWEGTKALFYAEVSLQAPDAEGLYSWEAMVPESDETISHAEGSSKFNVRVVPAPEFEMTVEAISKETQAPVSGARVVMHPYRTHTDEHGVAKINAAKGEYTLFVSKKKYDPMSKNIELTEDMSSKVELVEEDPDFNPDDEYA